MATRNRIRVTHWFAGTEIRESQDIVDEELNTYLDGLRNLRTYSSALRAAVEDVEIDLGAPKHTW